MGCIAVGIALLAPRLVIVLVVVFSDWLGAAYKSVLWPVLGFLFMPYTTLAYAGAVHAGGVKGLWLALVVLAAIIDIGHWGGGGRAARRRR